MMVTMDDEKMSEDTTSSERATCRPGQLWHSRNRGRTYMVTSVEPQLGRLIPVCHWIMVSSRGALVRGSSSHVTPADWITAGYELLSDA